MAAVFDAIASNIAVSAEMIDVIDTFFGQIDYTFGEYPVAGFPALVDVLL